MGVAMAGGCDLFDRLCGLGHGGGPCDGTDCGGAFQPIAALWGVGKCDRSSDYGVCGHALCDFGCSTGPIWRGGAGVLVHDIGAWRHFGCGELCRRSAPFGQLYQSTAAKGLRDIGGLCAIWHPLARPHADFSCYSRFCGPGFMG